MNLNVSASRQKLLLNVHVIRSAIKDYRVGTCAVIYVEILVQLATKSLFITIHVDIQPKYLATPLLINIHAKRSVSLNSAVDMSVQEDVVIVPHHVYMLFALSV